MNGAVFSATLLAAGSILAIAQPAFAVATNRACAGARVATGYCVYNNGNLATAVDNYSAITPEGATVRASAFAESSIGRLRASASSVTETFGGSRNFAAANPGADAMWTDNIMITGGPIGTRGYFIAKLHVSGSAAGGVTGYSTPSNVGTAGMGYQVNGTGFDPISFSSSLSTTGVLTDSINVNKLIDVRIDFYYGFLTGLSFFLRTDARSGAYTERYDSGIVSGATTDFSNTVAWGGISGVFDQSGTPRLAYTATAESGFDYTKSAVPEPAAWALMITGFGLVGGAARRRRNTAQAA